MSLHSWICHFSWLYKKVDIKVPEVPPLRDEQQSNCDGVLVAPTGSASEDQTVPASDL